MIHPVNSLSLFLTEQCNLRCEYCYVSNRSGKQMDRNTARRAVDFLLEASNRQRFLHLSFWGGEPLLAWPLLRWIVEYSREEAQAQGREITFSIPTNLTMLNEKILEFIGAHHIRLSLSIDGTEGSQSLRRTTEGGSSYSMVRKNLDLLRSTDMCGSVSVRKTVTPGTVANLYRDVVFFLEHGLREITFSPVMETEWNEHNLAAFEEQQQKVADLWIFSLRADNPFSIKLWDQMLLQRVAGSRETRYCGAGVSMVAVDIDGRLFPCHRFVHYDHQKLSQCLGNVHSGIEEDSRYLMYNNIDRETRNNRTAGCPSCRHTESCLLFCPAVNFKLTRNALTNDPRLCRFEMICERVVDTIEEGIQDPKKLESYLERKLPERNHRSVGQSRIDELTDSAQCNLAEIRRNVVD